MHVGVTDVGGGAKTTMGLIAAEALDVPLSQVEVIWGDTARCPYSVGESGSRTTTLTGNAVVDAARDLKRQIAEKGIPTGTNILTAMANSTLAVAGDTRSALPMARISWKSKSIPPLATCAFSNTSRCTTAAAS